MLKLVADIESTGLDYKDPDFKVHCLCTYDLVSGEEKTFGPGIANINGDLQTGFNYLNRANLVIGQNFSHYDRRCLEVACKKVLTTPIFDTQIIARMLFTQYTPAGKGGIV